MMPYQDMIIAPFKEGERQDTESWLLPNDAFEYLENVFLRRGIIHKRYGTRYFGRVGHKGTPIVIATGNGNQSYAPGVPITPFPIIRGSVIITDAGGQETFHDNGKAEVTANVGVLTGDADGSGTINYATGAWTLTYGAPLAAGNITANFHYGDATTNRNIRGLFNLENDAQQDICLACDRDNIAAYDTTYNYFVTKPRKDYLTYDYFGNKSNLMWGVGYQDKQYLCDGINSGASGIWTYDPSLIGGTGAIYRRKFAIAQGDAVVAEAIGVGDSGTAYTATGAGNTSLAKTPIIPGTLAITDALVQENFTETGNGILNGDAGGSGTIDYETGYWTLTYGAVLVAGTVISAAYTAAVSCDYSLIMIPYNRRLVLFNTRETTNNGTTYTDHNQRARWSKTASETRWRADIGGEGSSLDAATNESIISAAMLRGVVIVAFERSIWLLETTGYASIPFRWRRLAGNLEINSLLGTIVTEEMVYFVGCGGIYGCDGVRVKRVDMKIPDFTNDNLALTYVNNCCSAYDMKIEQGLISYTAIDETSHVNTRMLVLGVDDGWFSEYDYGMYALGRYTHNSGTTWAELYARTKTWDTEVISGKTWAEIYQQAKEDLVLGGNSEGYVYTVNDTSASTNNVKEVEKYYNFTIRSKKYSPFVQAGEKTSWGYLDMLVDRTDFAACKVRIFTGESDGVTAEKLVTFQSDKIQDKIWKRVITKNTANAHGFELTMDGDQMDQANICGSGFRIHAFKLGFRPAGTVRHS